MRWYGPGGSARSDGQSDPMPGAPDCYLLRNDAEAQERGMQTLFDRHIAPLVGRVLTAERKRAVISSRRSGGPRERDPAAPAGEIASNSGRSRDRADCRPSRLCDSDGAQCPGQSEARPGYRAQPPEQPAAIVLTHSRHLAIWGRNPVLCGLGKLGRQPGPVSDRGACVDFHRRRRESPALGRGSRSGIRRTGLPRGPRRGVRSSPGSGADRSRRSAGSDFSSRNAPVSRAVVERDRRSARSAAAGPAPASQGRGRRERCPGSSLARNRVSAPDRGGVGAAGQRSREALERSSAPRRADFSDCRRDAPTGHQSTKVGSRSSREANGASPLSGRRASMSHLSSEQIAR